MGKSNDLRSVLEMLKGIEGQLVETDVEVDPHAELCGVYRYIGAGGTVMRPTRQNGPAMVFNNVKGHPDARVAIGVLASRERVGYILDEKPERLGYRLMEAVSSPIPPTEIPNEKAVCQEIVHLSTDPGFDIRKLIPAPTNTEEDAGPYITMGLCYATDPETGKKDITIHRLCLQSKDTISMYFVPGGRHLDIFREKYEKLGKPMPISISIGVDPAICIASCFESPTTPLGYDELACAGGLRREAVELTKCRTIDELCIANAEYVVEAELMPGEFVREDQNTNTGRAMPEFPGYIGAALPEVPVLKVKAVTTRKNPIMQTVIGPSEEHVSMAGIPTEASILLMEKKALNDFVQNVYCAPFGGGKYAAVIQVKKVAPIDEGKQRQAALVAFAAFRELKHCFLVDEDVDLFDINDVNWAMTTRFQADIDMIPIPGVRLHPLEPSSDPEYDPFCRHHGCACKAIFDCTVPFDQKERFKRCEFMEVDPAKWVPDYKA
ncbi:MAG: UbiD family decarboxylase [Lachnospiraceae bacterium]|nr:UbiD family decarboxylase [Lachnospiraceae bacterium]